jgi:hypothetical protein
MLTDVGEYIAGAYLRLVLNCNFVDYNVRTPGVACKVWKNWMYSAWTSLTVEPIFAK